MPVHVSECRSLAQARIQMTSPDAFDAHEWELVDRISRRAQVRRFGGDCHLFAQLAAGHVGHARVQRGVVLDVVAVAHQWRPYLSSRRLCKAFVCTRAFAFDAWRVASVSAAAASSSRNLR